MIQIDVVSPIHLTNELHYFEGRCFINNSGKIFAKEKEKERKEEKRKKEIKHLHKFLITFVLLSDLKKLISFN